MFRRCINLIAIPDISKWNTSNVINLNHLFYECINLQLLPDISGWDTSNTKNLSYIFYRCSALPYSLNFSS